MPNRLAASQSLYLRQHANNPVDWYPWGPEALTRAKDLDRPIFLSIGYSACHWCHVMEHESFEDPATAAVLNAGFVPIKVDREERPDLDQIYMTALQLLTREGGGWPLSVWLTPALTPFHAGTYFPPKDNYGRPSFRRVLAAVGDAWANRRAEIDSAGAQIRVALNAASDRHGDAALSPEVLTKAAKVLGRNIDRVHGGFGHAPKFPHAADLAVLLRAGDVEPVALTLAKMARGGIYDQIGGGFHRYSVDAVWLVPHFEKMLYDNAQLAPLYADVYRATGEEFFGEIAAEILGYVQKEMTSPGGAFYATQDADSEGEEGKFFVWSASEIDAVLGDNSPFAKAVFGVTAHGNFEGHNILCRKRSDAEDAAALGFSEAEFGVKLAAVKADLYAARSMRVKPGRDEKILSGWNGLMISAFARCGATFGGEAAVAAAKGAAADVVAQHSVAGKLLRTGGIPGYLEDYAYLAAAFVDLYEADFNPDHLTRAAGLIDTLLADFWDETGGGFFFTPADQPDVIARTKDLHDGSVPAGNAVAALTLIKLSHLLGRADYREKAERTLKAYAGLMTDSPMAAGAFLIAADWLLNPVEEVTVVGSTRDPETTRTVRILCEAYGPRRLIAFHDPATESPLPIFAFRPMMGGRVTSYVCVGQTCSAPLIGADAVRAYLAENPR